MVCVCVWKGAHCPPTHKVPDAEKKSSISTKSTMLRVGHRGVSIGVTESVSVRQTAKASHRRFGNRRDCLADGGRCRRL